MSEPTKNSFDEEGDGKQQSLVSEIVDMLKHNKKYWMIPIIIVLLVFGLILIFGGTPAAPFIYSFF